MSDKMLLTNLSPRGFAELRLDLVLVCHVPMYIEGFRRTLQDSMACKEVGSVELTRLPLRPGRRTLFRDAKGSAPARLNH